MSNDIMIGTWAWGTGSNGSKMVFGNKQDPAVLKQSFDLAVERGYLKWDTAAVYGMGTCETLLGSFIKGHDDLFISTKFFPGKKYKEGALVKSFEESMARLGRDHADLFWIHVPRNLEANLKEAVPLLKDGRIRSIGISNVSLSDIEQAEAQLALEGLSLGAVQNHFSLIRDDQQKIIDHCNSNGIVYYAYMVLEQGALSGHYSAEHHFPTFSMRGIMFPKRKFKKINNLLSLMRDMAGRYNIDPSQVPILWAIGCGAVPIIGVTKPSHVERMAAASEVSLTPEEISTLRDAAALSGIRQQGMWEPQ